jgi:adenylosuccinate synthase
MNIFKCSDCDGYFYSNYNMKRHRDRCEIAKMTETLHINKDCALELFRDKKEKMSHNCCPHCNKIFSTQNSMYRHMKDGCKIVKREKQKLHNALLEKPTTRKQSLVDQLNPAENSIEHRFKKFEKRQEELEEENEKLKTEMIHLKSQKVTKDPKFAIIGKPRVVENVKKTKEKIPQSIRKKVWKQNIGNTLEGICYACDKEIEFDNFDCGHIVSSKHGGLVKVNNLKPICRPCNQSCGVMNLDDYKNIVKSYA